jgi:hypothetical protein
MPRQVSLATMIFMTLMGVLGAISEQLADPPPVGARMTLTVVASYDPTEISGLQS